MPETSQSRAPLRDILHCLVELPPISLLDNNLTPPHHQTRERAKKVRRREDTEAAKYPPKGKESRWRKMSQIGLNALRPLLRTWSLSGRCPLLPSLPPFAPPLHWNTCVLRTERSIKCPWSGHWGTQAGNRQVGRTISQLPRGQAQRSQ